MILNDTARTVINPRNLVCALPMTDTQRLYTPPYLRVEVIQLYPGPMLSYPDAKTRDADLAWLNRAIEDHSTGDSGL